MTQHNKRPRFIIMGHARHGKDTACLYLQNQWQRAWIGSSYWAAEHIIMPKFPGRWQSINECYESRFSERAMWFDLIAEFNTPDGARLARAIFNDGYDIYCGMRNRAELKVCRAAGIVDHVIWIDASDRLPPEDDSSITVTELMADHIISNNGTEDELRANLDRMMESLMLLA